MLRRDVLLGKVNEKSRENGAGLPRKIAESYNLCNEGVCGTGVLQMAKSWQSIFDS